MIILVEKSITFLWYLKYIMASKKLRINQIKLSEDINRLYR